ncbi:hypothetical protein CAPTEDRAFT_189041 [Capitella teleta]|uniref:Galaxin-like repeats domain-containing protein n=1 Tax=Capitella teleta TaxID=283909 RepID=R7UMB6_CAPTE|nr:hypothetical protein CAPTEDRAFT_189041 [Capitella teleta]|eukprot:ELU07674.1 hypothetical protein CAPTEDRAFT_189041 [Capitella teleta]
MSFLYLLFVACILHAQGDDVEDDGLCAGEVYDSSTHICCNETLTTPIPNRGRCCGSEAIDSEKFMCCNDVVNIRPCGNPDCCQGNTFDRTSHMCCNGVIRSRPSDNSRCCDTFSIDANNFLCCDGVTQRRKSPSYSCCGTLPVDLDLQICCYGAVHDRPAGFTGKTCAELEAFMNGGTLITTTLPSKGNSTCHECEDECKWEVPFWILLAALLSLLTLLGLAALYKFCCRHRDGLCSSGEDEEDIVDYMTDEYESGYDYEDEDDSGWGNEAGAVGGGAGGESGARRGRSRRKTTRIRVAPSPDPPASKVVIQEEPTVASPQGRASSAVTSGTDDVFETDTDDEGSSDDGERWMRRGRGHKNKASVSRFKYTIVD